MSNFKPFIEAVHLRIIDFNPLPQQLEYDAYCKAFHNGFPCEEIPNKEQDEFLIQFKDDNDIVRIEVWANDEQGNFKHF